MEQAKIYSPTEETLAEIERSLFSTFEDKGARKKQDDNFFCSKSNIENLLEFLINLCKDDRELREKSLQVLCGACRFLLKTVRYEFHVKIALTCVDLLEKALEEKQLVILENCLKCLNHFELEEWTTVLLDKQRRQSVIKVILLILNRAQDVFSKTQKEVNSVLILCVEILFRLLKNSIFKDKNNLNLHEWYMLLFPHLFSENPLLRKEVYSTFCSLRTQFPDVVSNLFQTSKALRQNFRTLCTKSLTQFVETNETDWVDLWCLMVDLLDPEFSSKNTDLINCLLEVEERAFRSSDMNTRYKAFIGWKFLVSKFLSASLVYTLRRIKLLLQPLIASNNKTPELTIIKFEIWWQLIVGIQSTIEKQACNVLHPFLTFCFGPPNDSTTMNNGISRRSLVQHSINASFGSFKEMKGLDFNRADALAQILNLAVVDHAAYKLPYLHSPVLSEPRIFLSLSKILIHSVGECMLVIVNSNEMTTQTKKLYLKDIWKNLLLHVKRVEKWSSTHNDDSSEKIEKTEMIKNLFKVLLKLNEIAVYNMNLACVFLSPVLETILSVDNGLLDEVITSRSYYVGTEDILKGTPLLTLLDIFLSPGCLKIQFQNADLKHQSEVLYMVMVQRILHLGIGPAETTLSFTQAVMKKLDAVANNVATENNKVKSIWVMVTRLLTSGYVGIGREINQGTDGRSDFSVLMTVLFFPMLHSKLFLEDQDMIMRIWSQLFQGSWKNVACNGKCNGKSLFDTFFGKIMLEICRKKDLMNEDLLQIMRLVTCAFEQVPLTFLEHWCELAIRDELEAPFKLLLTLSTEIYNLKKKDSVYINIVTQFAKCCQVIILQVKAKHLISAFFIDSLQFLLSIKEPFAGEKYSALCARIWDSFLNKLTKHNFCPIIIARGHQDASMLRPLLLSSLNHADHRIHEITRNFAIYKNIYLDENLKCLGCKIVGGKKTVVTGSEAMFGKPKDKQEEILNRPLTAHQRQKFKERKDDIPALYQDLTQDSQPSFSECTSQDTQNQTAEISCNESTSSKIPCDPQVSSERSPIHPKSCTTPDKNRDERIEQIMIIGENSHTCGGVLKKLLSASPKASDDDSRDDTSGKGLKLSKTDHQDVHNSNQFLEGNNSKTVQIKQGPNTLSSKNGLSAESGNCNINQRTVHLLIKHSSNNILNSSLQTPGIKTIIKPRSKSPEHIENKSPRCASETLKNELPIKVCISNLNSGNPKIKNIKSHVTNSSGLCIDKINEKEKIPSNGAKDTNSITEPKPFVETHQESAFSSSSMNIKNSRLPVNCGTSVGNKNKRNLSNDGKNGNTHQRKQNLKKICNDDPELGFSRKPNLTFENEITCNTECIKKNTSPNSPNKSSNCHNFKLFNNNGSSKQKEKVNCSKSPNEEENVNASSKNSPKVFKGVRYLSPIGNKEAFLKHVINRAFGIETHNDMQTVVPTSNSPAKIVLQKLDEKSSNRITCQSSFVEDKEGNENNKICVNLDSNVIEKGSSECNEKLGSNITQLKSSFCHATDTNERQTSQRNNPGREILPNNNSTGLLKSIGESETISVKSKTTNQNNFTPTKTSKITNTDNLSKNLDCNDDRSKKPHSIGKEDVIAKEPLDAREKQERKSESVNLNNQGGLSDKSLPHTLLHKERDILHTNDGAQYRNVKNKSVRKTLEDFYPKTIEGQEKSIFCEKKCKVNNSKEQDIDFSSKELKNDGFVYKSQNVGQNCLLECSSNEISSCNEVNRTLLDDNKNKSTQLKTFILCSESNSQCNDAKEVNAEICSPNISSSKAALLEGKEEKDTRIKKLEEENGRKLLDEETSLQITCNKSEYIRQLSLMPHNNNNNNNNVDVIPKINRISTRSDWARRFGCKSTSKNEHVSFEDDHMLNQNVDFNDETYEAHDSLDEKFINSQDISLIFPQKKNFRFNNLKCLIEPGCVLGRFIVGEQISPGTFQLKEKGGFGEDSSLEHNSKDENHHNEKQTEINDSCKPVEKIVIGDIMDSGKNTTEDEDLKKQIESVKILDRNSTCQKSRDIENDHDKEEQMENDKEEKMENDKEEQMENDKEEKMENESISVFHNNSVPITDNPESTIKSGKETLKSTKSENKIPQKEENDDQCKLNDNYFSNEEARLKGLKRNTFPSEVHKMKETADLAEESENSVSSEPSRAENNSRSSESNNVTKLEHSVTDKRKRKRNLGNFHELEKKKRMKLCNENIIHDTKDPFANEASADSSGNQSESETNCVLTCPIEDNQSPPKPKLLNYKPVPKTEVSSPSQKQLSGRAAHLLDLALTKKNEESEAELKSRIINAASDEPEESNHDVIFSFNAKGQEEKTPWVRHVPQSEASPGKTNLKRKFSIAEDINEITPKKSVRFSDPEVTKKLHFGKKVHNDISYHVVCTKKGKIYVQKNPSNTGTKPSVSSESKVVWPSLTDCKHPVSEVVGKLGISEEELTTALAARNISTIGELCSLSREEVEELPIKSPKIIVFKLVLQVYEDDLKIGQNHVDVKDVQSAQLPCSGQLTLSDIKNYMSSMKPADLIDLMKDVLPDQNQKEYARSVLQCSSQSVGVSTENKSTTDKATSTDENKPIYFEYLLTETFKTQCEEREKRKLLNKLLQTLFCHIDVAHILQEIKAVVGTSSDVVSKDSERDDIENLKRCLELFNFFCTKSALPKSDALNLYKYIIKIFGSRTILSELVKYYGDEKDTSEIVNDLVDCAQLEISHSPETTTSVFERLINEENLPLAVQHFSSQQLVHLIVSKFGKAVTFNSFIDETSMTLEDIVETLSKHFSDNVEGKRLLNFVLKLMSCSSQVKKDKLMTAIDAILDL